MSSENELYLRLTDLEMKFTRQDDVLEQLNTLVYEQQKKIDELNRSLKKLEEKSNATPANERPPHY